MAALIWTGVTDNGDFGDVDNWIDAATLGAPSDPPASSDTLIFDRGSKDVTGGLTTGLTGVIIRGTPGYNGRIAPASALSIACASLRWQAGYASFAGNITAGWVRSRRGSKFNYVSGTATALWAGSDVSIQDAAIVTSLRAKGCVVDAGANATGFTLAQLAGGAQLLTRRSGTFVVEPGSRVRVLGTAAVGAGTVIETGGAIYDEGSADAGGSIEVRDRGLLDLGKANVAKTIPSLIMWEGASVNLYTGAGKATVTAETVYGMSDMGSVDAGGPVPV